MAQIWIREYDSKKMYFDFIWEKYDWIQIKDLENLKKIPSNKSYTIKPDMLFGKRWKRGLLGLDLDKNELVRWMDKNYKKTINIDWVTWELDVFLLEKYQKLKHEYYVSFSLERDWDKLAFFLEWWMDIEENWEKVSTKFIYVNKELTNDDLNKVWVPEKLKDTIKKLFYYYRKYGFTYLEVNPLSLTQDGKIDITDMVAKVDDMEIFRQKSNWKDLEIPQDFWYKKNSREEYIKKLDSEIWASMKFKVLNKNAKIWLLLSGWWWSLIITDTLSDLGFTDEIWNYWELSWNPDRENTREYTRCLVEQMLENKIKGKYLIIAWAIANFTHIDKTFAWIIDIFEEKIDEIKKQEVQVLVRRWGINDKKWLKLMKESCENLWIPCKISDSSVYMTNILKEVVI